MRILLLSDPGSAHTIKWANNLYTKGIEIFIFGLTSFNPSDYIFNSSNIFSMNMNIKNKSESSFNKFIYLKAIPNLKTFINKIKPDIIHAHYLTSYGLLGQLSSFHPLFISVWGSDIFSFPNRSVLHKILIKYLLNKADFICSTSKIMKKEIEKYTFKNIDVIPFGIDLKKFFPEFIKQNEIVIGTIKTLEEKYGINDLINAFNIVAKNTSKKVKLLIVGGGSKENEYKTLVKTLKLEDKVEFTGYITPSKIQEYHNSLDIPVYLASHESFGVSLLESMATRKPVIAYDAPGYIELVENEYNGYIVKKGNIEEIANKILFLINNEELRFKLGENALNFVSKKYNLDDNINYLVHLYSESKKKKFDD